jgi:DNA-binding NtrC family response regulator
MEKRIDLLIVDDDAEFRETIVRRFQRRNFLVAEAPCGEDALRLSLRRLFDVAIIDLVMPGMSGIELLEKFHAQHPECEVVMLTGQGTIETAVQAMKLGAVDFLTKPFPLNDLEQLVEKVYQRRLLKKENQQLKSLLSQRTPKTTILGESPAIAELKRLIGKAGPSGKAILIQGESGVGKELVARSLHETSDRVDKPLVIVNCAALPESLLESELFGHEKGSFTGAIADKQGLFEVADGGTLFIDEIGEMPGSLQAKLLRVLEDGSMRRVGSVKERRIDVRLLAATNRNMVKEVAEGRFREDLYYRINVMSLIIPPLRDRVGDAELLIHHFLGSDWKIEPEALGVLSRYNWPGNVRQLINAVERAKILADDGVVHVADLPQEILQQGDQRIATPVQGGYDNLATIEKSKVVEVLAREQGNKTRAARRMGIDRRKLYRLLEKYNLVNDKTHQTSLPATESNGNPQSNCNPHS